MTTIETNNLILRNWQEADAPALYRICRDEALRKSGVTYVESIQSAGEAIRSRAKDTRFKAVIHRESGNSQSRQIAATEDMPQKR